MSIGLQLRTKHRLAPWVVARIRYAYGAHRSTREASLALGVSESVLLDACADSPMIRRTCERLEALASRLPEPPHYKETRRCTP